MSAHNRCCSSKNFRARFDPLQLRLVRSIASKTTPRDSALVVCSHKAASTERSGAPGRECARSKSRPQPAFEKRHGHFLDGIPSPEVVDQHPLADSDRFGQSIQAQVKSPGADESRQATFQKLLPSVGLFFLSRHLAHPMYHVVHLLNVPSGTSSEPEDREQL